MATLSELRDEILSRPIRWTDRNGVTHAVTGDYVVPTDFVCWTACGQHDVPAGASHYGHDDVTCLKCLATGTK